MKNNKKIFKYFELGFDILYLVSALGIGLYLLLRSDKSVKTLSGIMALILVIGDSFHLVPRIKVILYDDRKKYQRQLGFGKFVTSITMTVFYVILWNVGLMLFKPVNFNIITWAVYILALIRIVLCLFPQNKWLDEESSINWGIYRNIPFILLGSAVSIFFYQFRNVVSATYFMWLAIVLSYLFYIPVVLWSKKNPKIGMLMLPKSCVYIWMLVMCIYI